MSEISEGGEDQVLLHLTDHVLSQIPDQEKLKHIPVPQDQPEVVPLNFDGIRDIREQLQCQAVRIPRSEVLGGDEGEYRWNVRKAYRRIREHRKTFKVDNKEHILKKRDEKSTFLSEDSRVFIAPDEFPYHVDQAGDAAHFDVWVTEEIGEGIQPREVAETIAKFLSSRGLGERDYVLIQNPPTGKTLPEVEHLHLFIRVNES